MKNYSRYLPLSLLFLASSVSMNDDRFWNDYQQNQRRLTTNYTAIDFVSNLTTYNPEDTPQELNYKKQALAYFFATRGKNGFSSKPATPQEKEILTKAAMFLTFLHCYTEHDSHFNILTSRRVFGKTTETAQEKQHLINVQRQPTCCSIKMT